MTEFTTSGVPKDDNGAYRVEVIADSSGKWTGNGVRFATQADAEEYARDLFGRWTSVREWRVMAKQGGIHPELKDIEMEVSRG